MSRSTWRCGGNPLPVLFRFALRSARSTLFPYTTLFRSRRLRRLPLPQDRQRGAARRGGPVLPAEQKVLPGRSEEHTSELQSQSNLVCRLLLEKKNVPVDRDLEPT